MGKGASYRASRSTAGFQTHVGVSGAAVTGFHTIVASDIQHADAPARAAKGMPHHRVPLLVLARLAVHSEWQGRRIGAGLLLDALRRTLQVADIVGVRALAVHAKDDAAAAFYRRFGFVPSPTDERHLSMLMKDIVAASGG